MHAHTEIHTLRLNFYFNKYQKHFCVLSIKVSFHIRLSSQCRNKTQNEEKRQEFGGNEASKGSTGK